MTIRDRAEQHRIELERLELMNGLADKLGEQTARNLMAQIPGISAAEIATKADLEVVEKGLCSRMDVGFAELHAKIDVGLAEVNAKIDVGLTELNTKIDVGLTEVRGEMAEIRGEMAKNTARVIRAIVVTLLLVAVPSLASLVAAVVQLSS